MRRARRGRLQAWSGIDDDADAMVPDGGPEQKHAVNVNKGPKSNESATN